MSFKTTVILLAAGEGTRMGYIPVPKPLLPVGGESILSKAINLFDTKTTQFIIAIRMNTHQLFSDYLSSRYADELNVAFVVVPEGELAGPPVSLHACITHYLYDFPVKDQANPIWVMVADTLFEMSEAAASITHDLSFLSTGYVGKEDQPEYTTVSESQNGDIHRIYAKFPEFNPTVKAWTGLAYIGNTYEFYRCLNIVLEGGNRNDVEVDFGEVFQTYRKNNDIKSFEIPWINLGTKARYDAYVNSLGYDYSKPDQITYASGNRVVKWFEDEQVAKAFLDRSHALPFMSAPLLPRGLKRRGKYVSYERITGESMYAARNATPGAFATLLRFFQANLWGNTTHGTQVSKEFVQELYVKKTLERLHTFLTEEHGRLSPFCGDRRIDNREGWIAHITNIEFHKSLRFMPGMIHGDLTLDNIILTPDGDFKLIDWRPELGSASVMYGDVYYDLAKLYLSCLVDLRAVKQGRFSFHEDIVKGSVTYELPTTTRLNDYREELASFCIDHSYDWRTVILKAAILMAGMAGIHKPPFDKVMYYASLDLLHNTIDTFPALP